MGKYSKWVFGALGWAFGGPIGALFGFILGAYFDSFKTSRVAFNTVGGNTTHGDFRLSLLALLAAIMRADNKNLKVELDYIKNIFSNTYGEVYAQHSMPILKDLLTQNIPVRDICLQIRLNMDHASRLELVNILFTLCMVDGDFHQNEQNLLKQISMWLGISTKDFGSMHAMHNQDTDWAYKVLEVSPDASDDEVRRAYRRMATKYHPDKVAYLGEEVAKTANEKFKTLNKAWEQIQKKRNIK